MTKEEREIREYKSLYSDERYAKRAWKELMDYSLQRPGKKLPVTYDKEGNPTFQSELDRMAYESVKARLIEQGKEREPQQAELIVESNILRARFNDTTFSMLLDRTAGKVKDEITINSSPFEELTDEELDALTAFRKSKETEDK